MNYLRNLFRNISYPLRKKKSKEFSTKSKKNKKYKKQKIPKALKQQVWLNTYGKKFESKCYIIWCNNKINCFTFDCGHNIPESKGGKLEISNLKPLCRNCNLGMGNQYTIDEWNDKFKCKNSNNSYNLFYKIYNFIIRKKK